MGKKRLRKQYISKNSGRNVSRTTLRDMRGVVTEGERFLNKFKAYLDGKNPWITIENPDREKTNKPFIRVKAVELWGQVKDRKGYMIT